ncbi:lipid carrier protein [Paramagnetospirillum kuznetsovii]|uniref:Lipid carrier protein n=1 Tax=Paramagnetospirillum kuznetsovii TaxID=2053833 RepID=A0A364NTG5_9PROT|nr:SCP2 sterol-binding domain-containing protein [Paramagnetospirillum kuznetsovii]RAU20364.1 lipid carrier protein [Paramagnetospirillum kuznetsovii]
MRPGQVRSAAKPATPPFSPVLLLGLALKPMRPQVLQPIFDAMLRMIRRRHPDILERMADYADRPVCIDPTDLPFVILLDPNPEAPALIVRREIDPEEVAATIHGPLATLIALAEGKVDGDALFFSRRLIIEGDTEVVVALRNAIDGAGIDLVEDMSAQLGPFGKAFRGLAGAAIGLADRMQADFETLRAALIAPAVKDVDAQSARIAALEGELKQLRKAARRGGVA